MHNEIINKIFTKMQERSGGFDLHYPFLYGLIIGMETKNILELGAGFSTPTILAALEHTGGTLITCDQRTIEETGNDPSLTQRYPSWKYLQGNTDDILPTLAQERFEVILHDASHDLFPVYKDLRKIIPLVKQNGIILVHDTAHPTFRHKWAVWAALLLTRHEKMTLPYGYGLTVIRILGNRRNGNVAFTWEKNKTVKNEISAKKPL